MAFIGNTPTQQAFTAAVDVFSGNGSTTAFTLSRPVASVAQVEAVIENVQQSPIDAYTVNGNTITFTSAPPSGTSNIYVRYTSPITQVISPTDGTVGLSALSSGVMSAISGMGFKNRIINGAMVIDQRNGGASVTPANFAYTLDRWACLLTQSSKFTVQKNAGSVTPPVGFSNYLGVTSSSAYSVLSTDRFNIYQVIEGFNAADLAWGTANAQPVTLTFQVRSSLTGTFSGSLRTGSGTDYSFPFTYTIPVANTWTTITINIAGPTVGTWVSDNTAFAYVAFSLGVGSTYSGTAGSWTAGNLWGNSSAVSVVGTSGATFYVTGVQLEKGSTATSFDYRPYGTELMLCQRYFELLDYSDGANNAIGNSTRWAATNDQWCNVSFKVLKRTTPSATSAGTVILYGAGSTATATPSFQYLGPVGLCMRVQPVTYTVDYGFVGNNSGFKISVSAEL